MNACAFVVPGRLDARTGGSIYNRRMVEGLRAMGWSVDVRELDESLPYPSPTAVAHASEVFDAIPPESVTLVDSLALGALPEIIERHGSRLRLVAMVHLPLAAAIGIDERTARRFRAAERRALGSVKAVIVTGRATLALLAHGDRPSSRMVVVEPGVDPAPIARGSSGSPLQVLTVATLNPGKGHEALLRALAGVPSRDWRLTCAGSLTRHPATTERLRAITHQLQLDDRVSFAGDLDAVSLADCYDRSDLFVLATLRETYGMAVAEALAHGLPVISTRTGAIADLVGPDAGEIVEPGDVPALSRALTRVMTDDGHRRRLAAGARRVRTSLRRWEDAVTEMAATLESVGHG